MFLVLGQPRSGTTLVAQCLSAHPRLVLPDESDVVIPLAFLCDRIPDPEVGLRLAADLVVATSRFEPTLGQFISADTAREAVLGATWTTSDILGRLYGAVAAAAGVDMAGDKSPNDHKYARVLANSGAFDGAIPVIHVVRDVRDVMASYNRLAWVEGFHPNMPRIWATNNLYIHENAPSRGAPYLLVRYEDLVDDPKAVCAAMGEFLGVGFDPAMLDEETRYAQFPGHADIRQHRQTYQPITSAGVGRHRGRFDAKTQREVERLAGDVMAQLGYEFD